MELNDSNMKEIGRRVLQAETVPEGKQKKRKNNQNDLTKHERTIKEHERKTNQMNDDT